MNPIFKNHCINFEELLKPELIHEKHPLGSMLAIAHRQSKTEEAKIRVDLANYKQYESHESCPAYFGLYVEWLAYHFLNHHGSFFNIQNVNMSASEGSTEVDLGIDGIGYCIKEGLDKQSRRKYQKGSPVYIQVKGTTNRTKEYSANDGSRLSNFGMNAMATAITSGHAYQARYIIFTTGSGIKYTLNNMSKSLFEVINYEKINALIKSDVTFLNRLRESVGLGIIDQVVSSPDPEWEMFEFEVDI